MDGTATVLSSSTASNLSGASSRVDVEVLQRLEVTTKPGYITSENVSANDSVDGNPCRPPITYSMGLNALNPMAPRAASAPSSGVYFSRSSFVSFTQCLQTPAPDFGSCIGESGNLSSFMEYLPSCSRESW